MLEGILYHQKEGSVVSVEDKWATVRWIFRIKWKDGTTEWVPLKLMKESNPVEMAEYVVSRKLDLEPAFTC